MTLLRAEAPVLFTNPWVTVDTVPAVTADGEPFDHTRVVVRGGLGAVVLPVTRHRGLSRIGFVTQPRPAAGLPASLELPRGGTSDLGADGALRELLEETGLATAQPLRQLGVIHPDTGILSTQVAVWSVGVAHDDVVAADGFVEVESLARTEWLGMGQVLAAVATGRITCGITLAALMLARDTIVDVL